VQQMICELWVGMWKNPWWISATPLTQAVKVVPEGAVLAEREVTQKSCC